MSGKGRKSTRTVEDRALLSIQIILVLVMLVLIWKIGNYLLDDIKSLRYSGSH